MKTLCVFALSLFTYSSVAQCANYALDINYSEPSCFGANDGDISLSTTGGNGGDIFEISFNGSIINVSSVANNLTTGTYLIEATDNMGCQIMETFILDEPGELDIDFTVTHPHCFGDATGKIVIDSLYNYVGNNNGIFYTWSPNPNGSFNNVLTGASADLYQVQIVDDNGCSGLFEFTLENPDSMYFDQIESTNCVNGSDGEVSVSVTGGNGANYSYLWTETTSGNTSGNSTWSNLNAGTYVISAMNAFGCVISDTLYIGCLGNEEMVLEEIFVVSQSIENSKTIFVKKNDQNSPVNCIFIIYDIMGKEVFCQTLESNNKKLYPDLENGKYIYTIQNIEKDEIVKKGKLIFID